MVPAIILSWALTFGAVPDNLEMITGPNGKIAVSEQSPYFATLELSAEAFGHLRIEGAVETYMTKAQSLYFSPYRADYTFGVALYAEHFEVGFRHECDHGVLSGSFHPWYGSNETQVYVKISGQTDF